jgi:hypothetical protein
MSMNLTLKDRGTGAEVRIPQTPTDVTFKILKTSGDQARHKAFIDWLNHERDHTLQGISKWDPRHDWEREWWDMLINEVESVETPEYGMI